MFKKKQQCSKQSVNIAEHAPNELFLSFKNELNLYEKSEQKTKNIQRDPGI